jgi:hypothetical protein
MIFPRILNYLIGIYLIIVGIIAIWVRLHKSIISRPITEAVQKHSSGAATASV